MATIKGKWLFNKVLTDIDTRRGISTPEFSFRYGTRQCTRSSQICIGGLDGGLVGGTTVDAGEVRIYANGANYGWYYWSVYENGTWREDHMRVVDFGVEGLSASDEFDVWFQKNAKPLIATVKYKGEDIGYMVVGQTATLDCTNKKMTGAVSIVTE